MTNTEREGKVSSECFQRGLIIFLFSLVSYEAWNDVLEVFQELRVLGPLRREEKYVLPY